MKLETTINTVLQQLKPELASETWESRRRYFNQMKRLAEKLDITEPCRELYDAFIAEDNGSPERHSLHVRCVKLVDALAGTQSKDEHGILFNEPSMPDEAFRPEARLRYHRRSLLVKRISQKYWQIASCS